MKTGQSRYNTGKKKTKKDGIAHLLLTKLKLSNPLPRKVAGYRVCHSPVFPRYRQNLAPLYDVRLYLPCSI